MLFAIVIYLINCYIENHVPKMQNILVTIKIKEGKKYNLN